ncbi:hypothetical protein ACL07V_37485 [Streptomyces sp. MB22_4]|uniref:hypothetical protein n=1 Tax=Streptomyces sp. MB22_4 TaxID=3383120 RepID=UPI0039A2CE6A
MTGQHHVHTAGNAIPNVDDTELGGTLTDLASVHAGIDLIRTGIRLLAHDRHDLNTTQVLLAALAGSPDGTDVLAAIGQLVERLTSADTNPAVRALPIDQQKEAAHQGWLTQHNLTDPELRDTASRACAALDIREEVPAVTDTERKELSQKVAEANRQSNNRPK